MQVDLLNTPIEEIYQKLLINREKEMNALVKDILGYSQNLIKNAKVEQIADVLYFFKGNSPTKKKLELIEFMRLNPAYWTCDKEKLISRIEALKSVIKQRDHLNDLILYAKLQNQDESEEEGQLQPPNL